jgi:hypothetical protein
VNRIISIGSTAIAGDAKSWKMNPIAMNVIAIPASADSSAARGVTRRSQSPTNAPAISITPLHRQANSPIRQASRAASATRSGSVPSPAASRYTGPMISSTYASRLGVLIPYGSAVTSSRPVSRITRRACRA